jgi:hypothetical protein
MADEPVEEEIEEQPGEIDEEDLEGLAEEDLLDEEDIVADDDAEIDDELVEEDEEAVAAAKKAASEEEDEDELEVDHDVEATLDEILKERLVVVEEEEEDDEPADREDQGDSGKVAPKRPDEFVCQSCFLVKHPSQLADAKRQYCRDCV